MHFADAKAILTGSLAGGNGMNVYRGCSHGCIYCDSRSRCYGFTHAFEDIEVKQNAPELLERALRAKRKRCMIGSGSMCDPYMPCEKELQITRKCLELIRRYGFGATVLTKSTLVLRDIDLLAEIHQKAKAVVQMTLTTCDEDLCRIVEPNVSTTRERFLALKQFHERKVPTIVWLSPILPFINDTDDNLGGILDYCIDAGVYGIVCFDMGMTLRDGDREYFYAALDKHFPGMKERYIREFGNAYQIRSPRAEHLSELFHKRCREHGIVTDTNVLFAYMSDLPERYEQMTFEDYMNRTDF